MITTTNKIAVSTIGTVLLASSFFAFGAGAAMASEAMITSPTAGEVVYKNQLSVKVSENYDEARVLRWRIRDISCENDSGNVGDNVMGQNISGYQGPLDVELDISGLEAGAYCFVYNTLWNDDSVADGEGSRLLQTFYVVDKYAKIGGNVDNADYLSHLAGSPALKALRGKQLSHALSGVIGDAGSAGIVGSLHINYRQLKEQLHFSPTNFSLGAASGIGVTDPTARAEITMDGGAKLLLVDKKATSNFPRGAVVFRHGGSPSNSIYEIDGTPGLGGILSWMSMSNGNVEVGVRN